jgi:hypothetical protein
LLGVHDALLGFLLLAARRELFLQLFAFQPHLADVPAPAIVAGFVSVD